MTTPYSQRTTVSTNYSSSRMGGSFLKDVSGNFIRDVSGNRIIVLSPSGTVQFDYTKYSVRTPI